MFRFIRKYLTKFSEIRNKIDFLYEKHGTYDLHNPKFLSAKILNELNRNKNIIRLNEVEFSVFSQFGDDGIIQFLIENIDIPNKTFIEFGVENYTESNTRFLLINNNWSGLVIDGNRESIDFIKKDPIYTMHDIHVVNAFVTQKNINNILNTFLEKGYNKEIGLLSIDIDGNDYWIWKAINSIDPIIIIIEYNSIFTLDKAWVIPYSEDFVRSSAHFSLQYWGASLKSLYILADQKGYSFIGCNSAGNNAYFVRKDKLSSIKEVTLEQGYVLSKFREAPEIQGDTVSIFKRFDLIKGMAIFDTVANSTEII